MQLDIWWGKVFRSCKYSTLSLVVKACLSIFTGPHVEASFSRMNDIIDKKSNCMGIDSYSGVMNVKYSLQTKTSSKLYKRSDLLHKPLDKKICYFILTSNVRFKKRTAKKKQIREKRRSFKRN